MTKNKFKRYIKEEDVDNIFLEYFPNKQCKKCGRNELFPGAIETFNDEESEISILLSFSVFCKYCGNVEPFKWDNTNTNYFFGKRNK